MEFQQSVVVKLLVHRNPHKKWFHDNKNTTKQSQKLSDPITTTTTPRHRWRNFFLQRSPPSEPPQPQLTKTQTPPEEFICPISGSLMADPVIVSSGHSFERASVLSCKDLNLTPHLSDGTLPDFSTVIPNLALKSAIFKWCHASSTPPPHPPNQSEADNLVRSLVMTSQVKTNTKLKQGTEKAQQEEGLIEERMVPSPSSSSSVESIATATSASSSTPPPQLTRRPSCYSSSSPSSSELEPTTSEAEEIISKLRSPQVFVIEEALQNLRKLTRTKEESRVIFCTPRMLCSLRSLVSSKYTNVQIDAIASVVNLSLEKMNKVRIVRSGLVPPLIEALRVGSPEAQDHASGALFSLALEDDNKTAIGVLGALPPLLHALRVGSERTRHDSALALYHLSMVQSNRSKLVKLGSVPVLINMVKSGHMSGRILSILGNLGCGSDGRATMLDAGLVECLVGLLNESGSGYGSIQESCVAVLYALSHGGLRFKAVAKAAGVVEVLEKMESVVATKRAREKMRRIMEAVKGRDPEEEDVDWEELLDSGLGCRTRSRREDGLNGSTTNSSEF